MAGATQVVRAYVGTTEVWSPTPPPTGQPCDEIWYTSTGGTVVTPYKTDSTTYGASIVSNTYNDGQGIILFNNCVTSIGFQAFLNCTSLSSIEIPNNVTSIGDRSIQACTKLSSITIPDSVTSIGSSAFQNCTSLSNITYNGTKAQWASVTKGNYWRKSVPATVVHCTDGDVNI